MLVCEQINFKKMKKYISISLLILFVATSLFFALKPTELEKEQKRVQKIIDKNDELFVMKEFLKGDSSLGSWAKQYAQDYIFTKSSFRFGFGNPVTDIDSLEQKIKIAFSVLEKDEGVKSFARALYNDYKYRAYIIQNYESGQWWQEDLKNLFYCISDSLKYELKEIVLEKKECPFWLNKYVSKDEMKDLVLANYFGTEKTGYFIKRYPDSVFAQSIARLIPDSMVFEYNLGKYVPKTRVYKITKKLDLDDSYNFFLESNISEKEIGNMLLSRSRELNGADILFYAAVDMIAKDKALELLKKKTTSNLVKNFPNRSTVNVWGNITYSEFSQNVIRSVKNIEDYNLAVSFFEQTTSSGVAYEKIEILNKKLNL